MKRRMECSKKLLVLDLNGTLVLRKGKRIIKRKYSDEFLKFIFENYHIGIFTSTVGKNVYSILDKIFTADQLSKIVFVWDRAYTESDPEPINEWDTIKNIDTVRKVYPYKDITVIDDSYRKLRFNENCNILVCESFVDEEEKNSTLQDLIVKLKEN